jgi:hemolysin III
LATLPVVAGLLFAAERWQAKIVLAVFGGSLLGVYGISAAYHRLAKRPEVQQIMRRLDHSMIFVLIAATYTALAVTSLHGLLRIVLLTIVWALTAASIGVKVWCGERTLSRSNALYALLSAPALLALPTFVRSVPLVPLGLLVLGGALYITGAVVFYRGRPDPLPAVFGYHEIWHVFTVLAGTSHLGMVAVLA